MNEYIKDHTEKAAGRLIQQYRESAGIQSLVKALTGSLQEIEDGLEKLYRGRWLDKASGRQIDLLGEIAGEERNFRDDEDYRKAIYIRIMMNNGGGTPEDIINAIRYIYRPVHIDYSESYPACFQVFIQGDNDLTGIKPLIRSVSPAGAGDPVITFLKGDGAFTFSECSSEQASLEATTDSGKSMIIVNGDSGEATLEVTADTLVIPKGARGFGEMVIRRSYLTTENGEIYMIDENTPLELIETYDDFEVEGGGRMSEVISNGQ